MIPGKNLLNMALSVISSDDFIYRKFNGRTTNDIGVDVATYDQDVKLCGSIQAVPRSVFTLMGLDWKRNYIMIYSSDDINGIARNSSGDRVIFAGNQYQVLSENDWRPIDGWAGILCVAVDP